MSAVDMWCVENQAKFGDWGVVILQRVAQRKLHCGGVTQQTPQREGKPAMCTVGRKLFQAKGRVSAKALRQEYACVCLKNSEGAGVVSGESGR